MGKGRILAEKTGVGGQGQFYQRGVNDYLVSGGFLLSLSMCKRVFHDLLRVRPFSLLMLHPSTPILGITSTLNAYEDGTASKFRNVGTKSSDAGRLLKRHNTIISFVNFISQQDLLPSLYEKVWVDNRSVGSGRLSHWSSRYLPISPPGHGNR